MSIIKSFSVGNGDMFYIKHNSDNFTIIDCCMNDDNKHQIITEIKNEKKDKGIVRFISTHPDEDHFHGLTYLDDQIKIVNFYCVENKAVKSDESEDFKRYCKLRDGEHHYYLYKGCKRRWMNETNEERGSSGINVLWPIVDNEEFKKVLKSVASNGVGVNNLSPIFTYSVTDGIRVMWMGDIEHDFLEKIKDEIEWPKVDVLFAPHHGRNSGKVSSDILAKISPHIIVIGEAPSEHLNYYSNYNTITQNSAGDIVFDVDLEKVYVYVSNKNYHYDTSFLKKENKITGNHGKCLGSFVPKGAK